MRNTYFIIGAGKLGGYVANSLSLKGENTILIDIDKSRFQYLPVTFSGLTVQGDATDIDVLKRNGIEDCKCLMIFTNSDNTNIFIAHLAKEYFKIKNIIVRLASDKNEIMLKGENYTVLNPFKLSIEELDKVLKGIK